MQSYISINQAGRQAARAALYDLGVPESEHEARAAQLLRAMADAYDRGADYVALDAQGNILCNGDRDGDGGGVAFWLDVDTTYID